MPFQVVERLVGRDGRLSRKIMFLNKVTDYSYTKFSSFQSIFVRIDYVRLEISG